MAQEESNIRREFIARLFSKSEFSADTISQASAALVADPDARYSIEVASAEAATKLRAFAQGPQSSQRLFVQEFGGSTYVFWQLGKATAGGRHPAGPFIPAGIAGIPCGYVESFSGLRGLPSAARTAERLALLLHSSDRGPLTATAAWARRAKQQLQDASLDLWADLDAALSPCRGGERERLEETVRHFLSTGNITTTALVLFCHRVPLTVERNGAVMKLSGGGRSWTSWNPCPRECVLWMRRAMISVLLSASFPPTLRQKCSKKPPRLPNRI